MKFRLLLLSFAIARSTIAAADPAAELASFSVFDKIDINDLAQSDVKTMHGPPMSGRYLSVQSVYVATGSPEKLMSAMRDWNPTSHRELKIFQHVDLLASPAVANFSKLKDAPDNGPVHALIAATEKKSDTLQMSRDEASKLAGAKGSGNALLAAAWSDILAGRARNFVSGGSAAQPPYDHTGDAIRPNEEINSLLKQQDKIRKQFSGFLSGTGIGRSAGSLTPESYWELLDVDDQGVLTLGASYSKSGGSHQAADVLYYASGGYYVALTLYQLWPVTANGKASTLVWRGDMISSASLAELHGVERLGSESAMMKDITKATTLFRKDIAR